MYNGKNRTPYCKDAFNDHIIPSHRPAEPEPERNLSPAVSTKSLKSPALSVHALPGDSTDNAADPQRAAAEAEAEEASKSPRPSDALLGGDAQQRPQHANTDIPEDAENIVEPPPQPVGKTGGRLFVNPDKEGTKAGAHYVFKDVPGKGGCVVVRLKMTPATPEEDPAILDEELFDDTIEDRRVDADEFYGCIARNSVSDDLKNIMRQALSGMLWYVYTSSARNSKKRDADTKGRSSTTSSSRRNGWKAIRVNPLLPPSANTVVTR